MHCLTIQTLQRAESYALDDERKSSVEKKRAPAINGQASVFLAGFGCAQIARTGHTEVFLMSIRIFAGFAAPVISAAICSFTPASADEDSTTLSDALAASKPIFDTRLRLETVEQAGFSNDAAALTYRIRAGLETGEFLGTKFLIEFDHVDALVNDFNSTINSKAMYPVVADPNATELNRFQITNTSIPDTTITIGRQRIILDDSRFVGNVGWRQNEQTFDAVRVQNTGLGEFSFDVSYVDQVNRIFGDESPVGRWDGDTYLVNVSHPTPVGKLTGFGYFIDIEDGGGVFSSQTLGGRLAGKKDIGTGSLSYAFSYAQQSDYADSPFDYEADYLFAEGSYAVNGFMFGAGYEVLGGDTQRGFQTPLATLHKFQGWTDKFLSTPATGVEDIYAKAGYNFGDVGFLSGLNTTGFYHDLSADMGGADYGSEFGFVATAKIDKVSVTLKFADYDADGLGTDTSKLWFQLDFAL